MSLRVTIRLTVMDGDVEKRSYEIVDPGDIDEELIEFAPMRHMAVSTLDALIDAKQQLRRVYNREVKDTHRCSPPSGTEEQSTF